MEEKNKKAPAIPNEYLEPDKMIKIKVLDLVSNKEVIIEVNEDIYKIILDKAGKIYATNIALKKMYFEAAKNKGHKLNDFNVTEYLNEQINSDMINEALNETINNLKQKK